MIDQQTAIRAVTQGAWKVIFLELDSLVTMHNFLIIDILRQAEADVWSKNPHRYNDWFLWT